ncbi:DUF1990 family protein [Jatrophihabitans sp. DSM 45814]
MPGRYRHLTLSAEVGRGEVAFRSAGAAIMSLQMQRGTGVKFQADHEPVRVGDVVRLRVGPLRSGPLAITGSCDVIEVFDEPRRLGFTYRTRRDHPEDGEETFEARWLADDRVVVSVDSWSRPNSWITRLGGPIARAAQRFINQRYLKSAQRIVAAER